MEHTRAAAGGARHLPSQYNEAVVLRLQPSRAFKEESGVILRVIVPWLHSIADALERLQASSGTRPTSNIYPFDEMKRCRESGSSWEDAMDTVPIAVNTEANVSTREQSK
jgi:hypothetical protein